MTATLSKCFIFEVCNPPHFYKVIGSGFRDITFDRHRGDEKLLPPSIVMTKCSEYSIATAMAVLAAYGVKKLPPATEQPLL